MSFGRDLNEMFSVSECVDATKVKRLQTNEAKRVQKESESDYDRYVEAFARSSDHELPRIIRR